MLDQTLLELAESEGFNAFLLSPDQVPVNPDFRKYCEENVCGKYDTNYSCPPYCGTAEEMHQKILSEEKVLIVQKLHKINGYEDKTAIEQAKKAHNDMIIRLKKRIEEKGFSAFCSGYSGCTLCSPCKRKEGLPCAYPDLRTSCISAYCIDVTELAKRCDFPFDWTPDCLHLFGLIAFHKNS